MSLAETRVELVRVLQAPETACQAAMPAWDRLLRLARRSLLLGTLGERFETTGRLSELPAAVRNTLVAELTLSRANARAVRWEAVCLRRALAGLGVPVVLLKGAAYAVADLPPARGRLFGDIDILVPRERLDEIERVLGWYGWDSGKLDEYDQRYYRTWMHELPPMMHRKRQSMLDVHHTILPPTSRYHPDPAKLRAAALDVPGLPGVKVLAPTDMVLHSACHLFHEGEWDHGLRDLHDLDALLRHFSAADPGFWEALVLRAEEMQLARPLHYALRYAKRIWQTPVPEALERRLRARGGPNPVLAGVMDFLFGRAFVPEHELTARPGDGLARFCLYLRGHWLRMPLRLLLPHLLRKAFRPAPKPESEPA